MSGELQHALVTLVMLVTLVLQEWRLRRLQGDVTALRPDRPPLHVDPPEDV